MSEPGNALLVSNPLAPCQVADFNPEVCDGCGVCVEVCRTDVFVHAPEEGAPPLVLFPDECWFCGDCVGHCPSPGAIRLHLPITEKVGWKDKQTGERYRLGMKDPPPANPKRPVGDPTPHLKRPKAQLRNG